MKAKNYTINIIEASAGMWLTQKEVDNIINTNFCKRVIDDSEENWIEITTKEKELLEKQIKDLIEPENEGTQNI